MHNVYIISYHLIKKIMMRYCVSVRPNHSGSTAWLCRQGQRRPGAVWTAGSSEPGRAFPRLRVTDGTIPARPDCEARPREKRRRAGDSSPMEGRATRQRRLPREHVTRLWCACVLPSSEGCDSKGSGERHCGCSADEDDVCVGSASSDRRCRNGFGILPSP